MNRRTGLTLGLAVVLAFAVVAPLRSLPQQGGVFRTAVDVVRVDVLVTESGRPVSGLKAADFEVTDNGVPQEIELAATAASVKVVLVLDTSGSVAGEKLEHLKGACRALFRGLRPPDSAALLTFSERLNLQVREESDTRKLEASLDGVEAYGRTAMRDALYAGLSLAAPDTSRTLLILFSDGADNSSWLSGIALFEALKHSSVIVYTVGEGSHAGSHPPPGPDRGHERGRTLRCRGRRSSRADVRGHPEPVPFALPADLYGEGRRTK